MDGALVRVTLTLIAPALLLVFAAAFFGIWLKLGRRRYVLYLSGGCLAFALGTASQVLYVPRDTGVNALFTGLCYTLAVCLTGQGILDRVGRRLPWLACLVFTLFIVAALAYFFYIERNLLVRVYTLNIAYGLFFCLTAMRLQRAARTRIDRYLALGVLVFGLHFLPRTLLSLGSQAPQGALAFADSPFWQWLQLSLAVFSVGLAIALLVAIAADVIDEVRQEGEKDWLTGVYNRRGFEARLRSRGTPLHEDAALIVCDIDHFKRINDEYGHYDGDLVLKSVAQALRACARKRDIVGRIGGEEFAVYLPDTSMPEARVCAERLRAAVEHSAHVPTSTQRVTVSLGVAAASAGQSWESVFRRADQKLYEAKRAGRNQVVG